MKPVSLFSCPLILITLFLTQIFITSSGAFPNPEYSDEYSLDDSERDSDSSSSEEDYQYDVHGAYFYEYGPITPTPTPQSFKKIFSTTSTPTGTSCICGRSNVNTRIVGGQVSANHAWPWMVAITNITAINITADANNTNTNNKFLPGNKYSIFCGGSIINDRYILTAGHCAAAIKIAGIEKFRVLVGTSKINGGSFTSRRVYKIASTKVHPKYVSMDNETVEYDAALVELDNVLVFNNNVLPICLGQGETSYVNSVATVAGWGNIIGGFNESIYQASNYLKDVDVQVISNYKCNQVYANAVENPKRVSPSMMCAYGVRKDSCNGDSGGPLFLKKSSPQFYRQIGIVSYATPSILKETFICIPPFQTPTYFAMNFNWAHCLVLSIAFLNWGIRAQEEETTTEAFVRDVESPEDSTSHYLDDYIDNELNGTLSDDVNDASEDDTDDADDTNTDVTDTDDTTDVIDESDNAENTGADEGELFLPGIVRCKCGVSNSPHRIINGKESAPGAWPWMAALVYASVVTSPSNQYDGFCGGSIINNLYILTAAHCAVVMKENGVGEFAVIVGDNNINGIVSSTRKVISVASVKIHPKYNPDTFNYDVALVKLTSSLTYNNNIRPICLGQAGSPYSNRNATVAGWGIVFNGNDNSASNSLRETTLRVLPNSECLRIINDGSFMPMTMMCAYQKGTNACFGDSGGPLVVRRTSSSQAYKQIGIVSNGAENCNADVPDVYTRVRRVVSWIRGATRDATYCGNSFTP
ncbi:unnamed protein product [Allacma fusca]|uniref:Peptidase S1 domain-containing protein n=1 Tax=Allacma fusca TaxID=39272 RepID=A0A8J2PID9_9HEXA|nr:unnamed protein product [Allacma fusca]